MLMQTLGAFTEFEREMIRERTRAGLLGARTGGRAGARKPKITAEQKKEIAEALTSGRKTSTEIARLFKIDPATVSRVLAQVRVALPSSYTLAIERA
jgi:DNA invertase Pin-like site-specific DNA recombinase